MFIQKLVVGSLATCVFAGGIPARPDGCYMPRESNWKRHRERSLINEPDQKALIFFDKGKEQLIISPNYAGDASDFAWVIPVPARPQIKILQGAPFHELARLAEPEPQYQRLRGDFQSGRPEAAAKVRVIERKTIGDYDVSVLSATDSQALVRWLKENGYHMPPQAAGPIAAYIKEGWTFVASKIKVRDSAPGLKSGTLTPLRLIFNAAAPIYPMRLSSVNPKPFSLLVYVALPQDAGTATRLVHFTLKTIKAPGNNSPKLHETSLSQSQKRAYPTLSGLSGAGIKIYWIKASIAPGDCDEDCVWANTTR